MLLLCEGPLFVIGLVILIIGRFSFYGTQSLRGKQARILGLTLMLPVLAPLIGVVFGVVPIQGIPIFGILTIVGILEFLILIGALIAAAIMIWAPPETSEVLPSVLTLAEVAYYLRVPEETVLQLVEKGELTARSIDGQYRFDREKMISFLKG